jgi:hypothetical protein
VVSDQTKEEGRGINSLRTNPEKNMLIHCIMTMFGTIMTACFFIPSIMPSICEGSIGFGWLDSSLPRGLRCSPAARDAERAVEREL